jgi:hypothetical protein
VSQQSANLALAGTAGGVLLGAALEPARASSSATTSVNVAASPPSLTAGGLALAWPACHAIA